MPSSVHAPSRITRRAWPALQRDAQAQRLRMAEDHERNLARMRDRPRRAPGRFAGRSGHRISDRRAESAERLADFAEDRDEGIEEARASSADRLLEIEEEYSRNRVRAACASMKMRSAKRPHASMRVRSTTNSAALRVSRQRPKKRPPGEGGRRTGQARRGDQEPQRCLHRKGRRRAGSLTEDDRPGAKSLRQAGRRRQRSLCHSVSRMPSNPISGRPLISRRSTSSV